MAAPSATSAGRKLSVHFVHPDLGIGGAEMLVVNAAMALSKRGHDVCLWTSHHDPARCFSETKPGGPLGDKIRVHGAWMPRTVLGRLHVVCAVLRMIYVALVIAVKCRLGLIELPDIFVCDQVSHVVPLLRAATGRQVVFYCHFPDKLLCVDRGSLLKRLYRAPIDWWEESSTGASDAVVVNSKFTASIFRESFRSLGDVDLQVLYPSIDMEQFDRELTPAQRAAAMEGLPERLGEHLARVGTSNSAVLLSINRFERKKNLKLAIEAFALLGEIVPAETFAKAHLVLAGGYDPRLEENVAYMEELERAVAERGLSTKVSFMRSFSDDQRLVLVGLARCVLYTPDREHFGIVPLEAMYAGCPVLAVASGGPLETVQDQISGFLLEQRPEAFAGAMRRLVEDPNLAQSMGSAGRRIVAARFSLEAFGKQLDEILQQRMAKRPSGFAQARVGVQAALGIVLFCVALVLVRNG